MASFKISGKLLSRTSTIQKTDKFSVRQFVIGIDEIIQGNYNQRLIQFQLVNKNTSLIDGFKQNDMIEVAFDIRSTANNKNGQTMYFTNLTAFGVVAVQQPAQQAPQQQQQFQQQQPQYQQQAPQQQSFNPGSFGDDLPF